MSAYDEEAPAAPDKPNTAVYCMICGEGDRVPGLLVCKLHLEQAEAGYFGFEESGSDPVHLQRRRKRHIMDAA